MSSTKAKKDSKTAALVANGTLNPFPDKVTDPKFREGDFFDPRDVVQVKYEMLRRVSVEQRVGHGRDGEYGVSRPTYYQAKANFDEAGVAGLVPKKRGPAGPTSFRARYWPSSTSSWSRASRFAHASWRTDPRGVLGRDAPEDDRARARRKKNSAMRRRRRRARPAAAQTVTERYETLRTGAFGEGLTSRRGAGSRSFFDEACGDGLRRRSLRARLCERGWHSAPSLGAPNTSTKPSSTSSPRWR